MSIIEPSHFDANAAYVAVINFRDATLTFIALGIAAVLAKNYGRT